MITHILGKTINELVYKSIDKLIMEGDRTPSRNGDVSSLNNVFLELLNPKSRHLQLNGRNNNIFATIAETFWVFSGDDKIDPLLSFFLPRAKDFSDDGISWYGAYGPRLYMYNQMDDIIQQFRNEGIFTRRASFYIGNPSLDTRERFQKKLGDKVLTIKDRPCNMAGEFFITSDKKLHMNMKSRSGDILWGIGSINIFEWTFFQEFILQQLKTEIDGDITLGTYNHLITNIHLYDFSGKQGYSVIEQKLTQKLGNQSYDRMQFPTNVGNFRNFCMNITSIWSNYILKSINSIQLKQQTKQEFKNYGVDIDNNILWKYVELINHYMISKIYGENEIVDLTGFSSEFRQSIEHSKFRKFDII
jgi:thymidylate synthase